MRYPIIGGNGYLCDICGAPLYPKEVIRVRSFTLTDKTGRNDILDAIGICQDCYNEHFKILKGRGKLREVKKHEK